MDKPITIKFEECKQAIIDTVNSSGLPMFAIEYILKDLYSEASQMREKQYNDDKQRYEAATTDYQKLSPSEAEIVNE